MITNFKLKLLRILTLNNFATSKFDLISIYIIFKFTVMFWQIFEKNLIHKNEKKNTNFERKNEKKFAKIRNKILYYEKINHWQNKSEKKDITKKFEKKISNKMSRIESNQQKNKKWRKKNFETKLTKKNSHNFVNDDKINENDFHFEMKQTSFIIECVQKTHFVKNHENDEKLLYSNIKLSFHRFAVLHAQNEIRNENEFHIDIKLKSFDHMFSIEIRCLNHEKNKKNEI